MDEILQFLAVLLIYCLEMYLLTNWIKRSVTLRANTYCSPLHDRLLLPEIKNNYSWNNQLRATSLFPLTVMSRSCLLLLKNRNKAA